MAKVLRVVATVAGAVALIATGAGALGVAAIAGAKTATIAAVASVTAGVASTGAQILAPKPIARGSPAQVTIEIEPPRPYIVGRVMVGGVLRHDAAYGATRNKVPNPYRWQVRVLSGVGPIQGIAGEFFDFAPIDNGYFGGFFNSTQSLGARPQATALVPPYGPAPGWDSSSRLSGCTHVGLNFLFDKDGKRFASGIPVYTALCEGEKVYDPRQDSTYPGGSGPCRAGVESTYVYSANPACHALTYALGRFQNGYRIFGLGQALGTIDLPAVVDWANDCDANEWTVNMVLQEGGIGANLREQRVRNLNDLCAAGGGRWYQAGGLLSFDWHRPRVALATLTDEDILEAGGGTDAVQSVRNRMNGVRPQYVSPEHNWQQITAEEIIGSTYRTEDGGKALTQTYPLNGVTNARQAGELASYAMADSRELGPMDVQAVAKWRFYRPGDCIQVDSSLIAYDGQAVINQRGLNPETFAVPLSLKSETPGKHDFALGKVADPPPTPILAQTPEERDLLAAANITPRAVDVEYEDGTPVENLQPAEPGATEGARLPSPGAAAGGAVGNIRDHTGRLYNPGELLNTSIRITPSGRLESRPLPGSDPVSMGQISLPDLGAASQIDIRRAENDIERLAGALTLALSEASRTSETLTDAGFYADPATGKVRIHAIEQTRERVSSAEIRLNAAEAQINLKASVNYVDEQLALAVIDPSQIADLSQVFVRLTAAEVDIDGLNAAVLARATTTELSLVAGRVTTAETEIDALQGAITKKVDTTTFNALETRVTGAESTLTALGDTASLVNQVRAVRLVEREQDANAEADLRALLQGDRAQRDQVAAITQAQQELRTDITGVAQAEAVARLALQVRIGQAEATAASETAARISGQNALATQITALTVALSTETANRNAQIATVEQARIDGDALIAAGLAQQATAARVADGDAAGQAEKLLQALLTNDKNRRETNGLLAGARQEITAQIVADREAVVAALTALVARVAGNEAALIFEQQVRATAIESVAQSITTLNASFTTALATETAERIVAVEDVNGLIADEVNARGEAIIGEQNARQQAVQMLTAAIQSEATVRADADGALAQQINTLNVTAGDLSAAITAANQARIDGDQVLAGQISTLTTTVNGNTASINQFAESINGLRARAGVRLDVNGRVTGWVLNSSAQESDFTLVVDTFRVFAPGMAVAQAPFEFSGGNLRLSGNVRVGGDLVVGGTLTADKFVADGVTRAYQAGNASAITLEAIEDVVTITIEMERPGTIILIADMQFTFASGTWDFELAVGSTVLKTGSSNTDRYASFSGVFFAPSAGTYVAKARAASGGSVTINPGGAGLVALRTYI